MLKKSFLSILVVFVSFYCYSAVVGKGVPQRGLYIWQIDTLHDLSRMEKAEYRNMLQGQLDRSFLQKDTAGAIISLIELSDLDRWKGAYEESFEKLWKAYVFALDSRDSIVLVRIDRNLGITYEIFNQDSLASQFLSKSLSEAKRLVGRKLVEKEEIAHCYFSLSVLHRNNSEFDLALSYLDSCEIVYGDGRDMPYVEADRGYIFLQMNKLNLAKSKLYTANKVLMKNEQRYQVVTLSFLGDLNVRLGRADSALYYYRLSLGKMEELDAHVEIKSDLLSKMSKLYFVQGQFKKAYRYMEGSRMAVDSLFNATSLSNSNLFEIKNKYQETIVRHAQKIKEQELVIVQERQYRARLVSVFVVAILVLFLVLLLLLYRAKIRKMKLQQAIEKEKSSAMLELKNKELTGFALKNLEKEKAVLELLEEIKLTSPKTYSFLKNKHVHGSNKMWEEFNLKFVELNSGFYEKLRANHPDLTPTEEKHCALIKLSFDSKEMSQILNISLQSVHTSRYRIKRKMGLTSEENLVEYIASL